MSLHSTLDRTLPSAVYHSTFDIIVDPVLLKSEMRCHNLIINNLLYPRKSAQNKYKITPNHQMEDPESFTNTLQQEKQAYPQCTFSTSESQSCSMTNGKDYICETISKIMRRCPGQSPVEVFRRSTKCDKNDMPSNEGNFSYRKSWSSSSQHSLGDAQSLPKIFDEAMKLFSGHSFETDDNSLQKDIFGELFKSFGGGSGVGKNPNEIYRRHPKESQSQETIGLPPHIKARILQGRKIDGPSEEL